MEQTVYVFGHKNPDTDSIVSATAFAHLKNLLGEKSYKAARAGQLNPQTDYIYKKFGVTPPEFIPDLLPKVGFYMHKGATVVDEMDSLWNAASVMRDSNRRVLPVVDKEGHYKALLSYNSFSKNVFDILDPSHHISVFSNVRLMCDTLKGTFCSQHEIDEIHKYRIISGATSFESFKITLETHLHEKLVVVTGDREDVQMLCVQHGIKALIISGGRVPGDKVVEQAKKNGTTVIVSSYDTASTAMLVVYSTPATVMSDHSIKPLKEGDLISAIKKQVMDSPTRLLPVVDGDNKLVGVMSEIDFHREPSVSVAMVDHNEMTQAVDGLENYSIVDIVDHHRIGTVGTKLPISFINQPVGSTATIVSKLYKDAGFVPSREIASLLLCGILSDTLILKSATTTKVDEDTAAYLAEIAGVEVQVLGEEIIRAGSRIGDRTSYEIINQDMKEYKEGGVIYTVSQIEVDGVDEIISRKNEFLDDLEIARRSHSGIFSALLVTDIGSLSSVMLVAGDKAVMPYMNFPKQEENVYFLKDVVSRKKQLVPLLTEILGSFGN
ncbi:MAG: putative manganese-dependent inorganic diphosphatase [Treponema sp.]|nr:putative manganese-dependent inorganic diphosphatase [Candidatus Treponema equifaecale]